MASEEEKWVKVSRILDRMSDMHLTQSKLNFAFIGIAIVQSFGLFCLSSSYLALWTQMPDLGECELPVQYVQERFPE